jgi:uncharacterized protein YbaR (Trm112 family)
MKNLFDILCCIWARHTDHVDEASLELRGDVVDGLLVCRGCGAPYLVVDGVPVLLAEDELLREEKRKLRRLSRRLEVTA